MAGNPVSLIGTVNWRTPASPCALTVSGGATNGCVGVMNASTSSKTCLISAISPGRRSIARRRSQILVRLRAIRIAEDLVELVEQDGQWIAEVDLAAQE